MKAFAILCIVLASVAADECPAGLMKALKANITKYLKGVYNKKANAKVNCEYNHDSNIFNLEHHVLVDTTYKKRKLSFDLKTHSSMFDLYNFTDFDGKICHSSKIKLKDSKDRTLIINSFLKKYKSHITDKTIKRIERKGQVCYKAVIQPSSRLKKLRKALI